eukprot:TRINITY_DN14642_c0_g1_i1.p1 TRINITY_DN14642_c0_g1~~TRINITY_DN14642_c0_g1_i1.p1  ORF type:complete len:117 (+),score=6.24 TRINITY_DN14642_c0_g1_i1:51-353(+)
MHTVFLLQWYFVVSVVGFILAALDKLSAKLNNYFSVSRISESTLLILATLGGFPGESLAFRLFRHKTRKQSFRDSYALATFLHFVALGVMVRTGLMHFPL